MLTSCVLSALKYGVHPVITVGASVCVPVRDTRRLECVYSTLCCQDETVDSRFGMPTWQSQQI